jgi:hypothetical protein
VVPRRFAALSKDGVWQNKNGPEKHLTLQPKSFKDKASRKVFIERQAFPINDVEV